MKLSSKQIRKILIFQKKIGVLLLAFGLVSLMVMINTQEDCTIPILFIVAAVYLIFTKNIVFDLSGLEK